MTDPTREANRWEKLQRLTRDASERLRQRARLTRLRARVSRLESQVETEKTRVGRALYPLVEDATIHVGLPEVQEGVETIARLREQIRVSVERIEELEAGDDA